MSKWYFSPWQSVIEMEAPGLSSGTSDVLDDYNFRVSTSRNAPQCFQGVWGFYRENLVRWKVRAGPEKNKTIRHIDFCLLRYNVTQLDHRYKDFLYNGNSQYNDIFWGDRSLTKRPFSKFTLYNDHFLIDVPRANKILAILSPPKLFPNDWSDRDWAVHPRRHLKGQAHLGCVHLPPEDEASLKRTRAAMGGQALGLVPFKNRSQVLLSGEPLLRKKVKPDICSQLEGWPDMEDVKIKRRHWKQLGLGIEDGEQSSLFCRSCASSGTGAAPTRQQSIFTEVLPAWELGGRREALGLTMFVPLREPTSFWESARPFARGVLQRISSHCQSNMNLLTKSCESLLGFYKAELTQRGFVMLEGRPAVNAPAIAATGTVLDAVRRVNLSWKRVKPTTASRRPQVNQGHNRPKALHPTLQVMCQVGKCHTRASLGCF